MLKLADYPDMLTRAAADLAPHDVAFYLRDLAAAFHSWYAASASWSTMRRWRAPAWRCWPPRARCCATRWRAGRQRARFDEPRSDGPCPRRPRHERSGQRGGFALGLVVGLLIGLALALGVALYITKAPVPFVNKVPQRTAEQDSRRDRAQPHWDPNAPLGGKPVARPGAPSAVGGFGCAARRFGARCSQRRPPLRRQRKDPAAILAGGARRPRPRLGAQARGNGGALPWTPSSTLCRLAPTPAADDAEQQRARLATAGSVRQDHRTRTGRPNGVPCADGPLRCAPKPTACRPKLLEPASNRRWCASKSPDAAARS
jgi:hypothetical protein